MLALTGGRLPATRSTATTDSRYRILPAAEFCDIREEADHYLATLIVGVNRAAATVMDNSPTPPIQPRAIVPGVGPAK